MASRSPHPLLLLAPLALAAAPAHAQTWREFAFVDQGVAVQFPAAPMTAPGAYPAASGAMAPDVVYALDQGASRFSLTVVDFTGRGDDEGKALRQTLKTLHDGGGVKLDVDECISGQDGRELATTGPDGAQSKLAVFTIGPRLYVLEAKVAAADVDDVGPDAIRFQQSIRFSGGRLGAGPGLQPACRGRAREASTVG